MFIGLATLEMSEQKSIFECNDNSFSLAKILQESLGI